MRILFAPMTVLALLVQGIGAGAETKIFIIENHRDGYGVDQCLATGANCGKPVASAYCQSREFGRAVSFRKIDPEEITGVSFGGKTSCRTRGCGEYVAIECTR
jgi:hypothetical protein